MNIESGWRLYSADFSINSGGDGSDEGSVTFVRDPDGVAKWHGITDKLNADEYPDLYVTGKGITIAEAITNANLAAAHTPELVV